MTTISVQTFLQERGEYAPGKSVKLAAKARHLAKERGIAIERDAQSKRTLRMLRNDGKISEFEAKSLVNGYPRELLEEAMIEVELAGVSAASNATEAANKAWLRWLRARKAAAAAGVELPLQLTDGTELDAEQETAPEQETQEG